MLSVNQVIVSAFQFVFDGCYDSYRSVEQTKVSVVNMKHLTVWYLCLYLEC